MPYFTDIALFGLVSFEIIDFFLLPYSINKFFPFLQKKLYRDRIILFIFINVRATSTTRKSVNHRNLIPNIVTIFSSRLGKKVGLLPI